MPGPARKRTAEDRARIPVRISPRASRDAIGSVIAGELIVRVTAPPVGGAANEAVVKLFAKRLRVARGRVRIARGAHSRSKLIEIDGMSESEVRAHLT